VSDEFEREEIGGHSHTSLSIPIAIAMTISLSVRTPTPESNRWGMGLVDVWWTWNGLRHRGESGGDPDSGETVRRAKGGGVIGGDGRMKGGGHGREGTGWVPLPGEGGRAGMVVVMVVVVLVGLRMKDRKQCLWLRVSL